FFVLSMLFVIHGGTQILAQRVSATKPSFSCIPVRFAHQTAEVPADEIRVLVRHYIGQTGALSGLGTMLEAVVKSLWHAASAPLRSTGCCCTTTAFFECSSMPLNFISAS
ncbi:hypothetical protein, partial [Paraburkholderia sp. SIMBA_054]|uniref:hypothetical protein n=1 Tax=Paraburkholderia sp. SIMBA_054 TaxID=3085795 RepID=UPI00397E5DBA